LVGQYASQAASGCVNCAAGFADLDQDPSSACQPCATGKYSGHNPLLELAAAAKPTVCRQCPAGTADTDANSGTPCVQCKTGQYSDDRATACSDCAPGRADVDEDPRTPCQFCRAGTFSAGSDGAGAVYAVACTACPAGKVGRSHQPCIHFSKRC
jgi:hypothetical protein